MAIPEWFPVYLGGLLLLHLVIVGYIIYRKGKRPAVPQGTVDSAEAGHVIDCEHCGEENKAGFRFCRSCVEELSPGQLEDSRISLPSRREVD